jgi:hypothetical protein
MVRQPYIKASWAHWPMERGWHPTSYFFGHTSRRRDSIFGDAVRAVPTANFQVREVVDPVAKLLNSGA